jgi:hypothetical protein
MALLTGKGGEFFAQGKQLHAYFPPGHVVVVKHFLRLGYRYFGVIASEVEVFFSEFPGCFYFIHDFFGRLI